MPTYGGRNNENTFKLPGLKDGGNNPYYTIIDVETGVTTVYERQFGGDAELGTIKPGGKFEKGKDFNTALSTEDRKLFGFAARAFSTAVTRSEWAERSSVPVPTAVVFLRDWEYLDLDLPPCQGALVPYVPPPYRRPNAAPLRVTFPSSSHTLPSSSTYCSYSLISFRNLPFVIFIAIPTH